MHSGIHGSIKFTTLFCKQHHITLYLYTFPVESQYCAVFFFFQKNNIYDHTINTHKTQTLLKSLLCMSFCEPAGGGIGGDTEGDSGGDTGGGSEETVETGTKQNPFSGAATNSEGPSPSALCADCRTLVSIKCHIRIQTKEHSLPLHYVFC